MVWKPNDMEAAVALATEVAPEDTAGCMRAARELVSMGARRVFLTLGKKGCIAADHAGAQHVPTFDVDPPLDFVGAGDSFYAAAASSLAAGASPEEAATLGNLAASVTVQKIGITGTASPEEMVALFRKNSRAG